MVMRIVDSWLFAVEKWICGGGGCYPRLGYVVVQRVWKARSKEWRLRQSMPGMCCVETERRRRADGDWGVCGFANKNLC